MNETSEKLESENQDEGEGQEALDKGTELRDKMYRHSVSRGSVKAQLQNQGEARQVMPDRSRPQGPQ